TIIVAASTSSQKGDFIMKADLYTKTVLTVITLCLLWMCARDFVHPVAAQSGAQRVVIAGIEVVHPGTPIGSLPISISNLGGGKLPVSVSIDKIDLGLLGPIPISFFSGNSSASPLYVSVQDPVPVSVRGHVLTQGTVTTQPPTRK